MPIVSTWVGVWWHQQNLGWIGLDHRHELPDPSFVDAWCVGAVKLKTTLTLLCCCYMTVCG